MSNVHPLYLDVLEAIKAKYQAEFGAELDSIYLRGSVPAGHAVPGFSDIDTFALVHTDNPVRWSEVAWAAEFRKELQARFDFVRHVDMAYASYDPDFGNRNPRVAMVAKTQSICIWGESILPHIRKFKPGPDMVLNLTWMREDMDDFYALNELELEGTPEGKSQEILKILIRCGYELVMEEEGKFTNSLYYCYESFANHYPQYGEAMRDALYLFLNPPASLEPTKKVLKSLGEAILKEAHSHKPHLLKGIN